MAKKLFALVMVLVMACSCCVFAEEVKRLYGMDNINTLDVAEVSNSPSNLNHPKTIIIFGTVGILSDFINLNLPIIKPIPELSIN